MPYANILLHMQAPGWRGKEHREAAGGPAPGEKWGHDRFQELNEDHEGANAGQYQSILGLL